MSEQEVTGFRRSVGDIHARTEDTHRRYPKAESLLGYAQRQAEKSSGLFTTSFIGEKVLKRPILRMDSAPANTTIRVVFIAAVHGDEPDAALALTYHATELFKRATEKNISLTIIPVTNVEGYNAGYQGCPELGKIADDNQSKKKFNLNRNWPENAQKGKKAPEIVKQLNGVFINEGVPLIFVSFHGDEDTEGGYIYYFGKDTVAVSGIKSIVERCFGLESYQGYIGDPKDVGTLTKVGEIVDDRDGSIEDYLNRQGCRYSFCVDLPMSGERSTVANRVKAVKEIGLKVISLAKEITGDNRQELTH